MSARIASSSASTAACVPLTCVTTSATTASWCPNAADSSLKLGHTRPMRSAAACAALKSAHSCVKLAPSTEMGSAMTTMDVSIVTEAHSLPQGVTGTMSP